MLDTTTQQQMMLLLTLDFCRTWITQERMGKSILILFIFRLLSFDLKLNYFKVAVAVSEHHQPLGNIMLTGLENSCNNRGSSRGLRN